MMTMWFVIFSNLVGQLVWIMQDHFQLIRLAMDFPSTVDSYLSVELERGAVTGPFASNPNLISL